MIIYSVFGYNCTVLQKKILKNIRIIRFAFKNIIRIKKSVRIYFTTVTTLQKMNKQLKNYKQKIYKLFKHVIT
jgi:hypothetical protein